MLKSDDKIKIILKGDLSRLDNLAAEDIVIDSAKTIQKRSVAHTAEISGGSLKRTTAVPSAHVKAESSSSKASSSSKTKLHAREEVEEPRKRPKTEEATPSRREKKEAKSEATSSSQKKKSASESKIPAQPNWNVGDTVYVSVLTWYNYGMCPFPDGNRSYCEGHIIAKANNKYTLRVPCFEEEYVKPLSYMQVTLACRLCSGAIFVSPLM